MEDITSSLQKKSPKNNNYLPIVIISLGAIVTTSVLLSLLHVAFLKYCKRRHRSPQTLAVESANNNNNNVVGLDNRVLNTIPVLFYSSKTRDLYRFNQDDQCVICLQKLNKGDLIRWLPNCGHAFHVPCIDHWFHAHVTCPICRSLVRAPRTRSRGLPRTRSGGVLCHSTKLVLPIQGLGPTDLAKVGLKRSLSMDERCVVIDTNEEQTSSSSSSTSSSSSSSSSSIGSSLITSNSCRNPPLSKIDFLLSRLYRVNSIRRFNYVSSMGFRSLHGSREAHGGTIRNNGILPY